MKIDYIYDSYTDNPEGGTFWLDYKEFKLQFKELMRLSS